MAAYVHELKGWPHFRWDRTGLAELNGFEGKMTSSKWARLTNSSQDTAARDIADLVQRRILVKDPGGGRSTRHSLAAID